MEARRALVEEIAERQPGSWFAAVDALADVLEEAQIDFSDPSLEVEVRDHNEVGSTPERR